MILPVVPERALLELGRTEGGPDTLRLLVRDQHTRRLLLLRAVLDAAEAADAGVCSAGARGRLLEDWALLEEAERTVAPSASARVGAEAGTYGPVRAASSTRSSVPGPATACAGSARQAGRVPSGTRVN